MIGFDFTPSFLLQNSPNNLLLTDITDYASQGILGSQVAGVFELKSAVGIFHSNTDYLNPDIDLGAGTTFTKNLPLDSNGVVLNGQYDLKYSVKITAEAFAIDLIGIDQTGKRFIIAGNHITNIVNCTNGVINITGYGANVDTYNLDFSTTSYDSTNNRTFVGVIESIPDPSFSPYTMEWTADTIYTLTKVVDFCFLEPSVNLEVTSDCFKSQLIASDLTNYQATSCGVTLQPLLIVGFMQIEYPINPISALPMHPPEEININNQNVSYTINPVCTGTFQVTSYVDVTYMLPDGTLIIVALTGYKAHEVECENGLCCASQCIENVKTNYDLAKRTNLVEAAKLEKLLINILSEWMLYSIFVNCGNINKAQTHLANIIALVQANNCNCCPENSVAPVWIASPIGAGTGTTTVVSTCGNGITVTPSGTNPITYQVCLDTDIINSIITIALSVQKIFDHSDTTKNLPMVDGQVFMYDLGTDTWQNITLGLHNLIDVDMVTNAPANGYVLTWNSITGVAEFVPSNLKNVLLNDIADVGTDANYLEKTLKEITLSANELAVNGDNLFVEAYFTMITGVKRSKNIRLYFGAIPSLISSKLDLFNKNVVKVEAKLSRVDATTVFGEIVWYLGNNPAYVSGYFSTTATETLANALKIRITGQNIDPGFGSAVANDLVCKYLRVTKNNKK